MIKVEKHLVWLNSVGQEASPVVVAIQAENQNHLKLGEEGVCTVKLV